MTDSGTEAARRCGQWYVLALRPGTRRSVGNRLTGRFLEPKAGFLTLGWITPIVGVGGPRRLAIPARCILATFPRSNPSIPPSPDVTRLLIGWGAGEEEVGEQLLSAVYAELHRQAARAMRRESDEITLQATALVHEAYLRLIDQSRVEWRNRAHFFGVAAQLMRRILVDHARRRRARKRGDGVRPLALDDADMAVGGRSEREPVDVLVLNDALERLAELDDRQSRIVELRYFAGLNIEDTAEALHVSPATVKREWAVARAWLRRELARS
jgi:RNA polymerase sigma factor (TIGR02999 family)